MSDHHDAATTISAANQLRKLLSRANLGQREAARLLGVDERAMRQWCSGHGSPPASVFRALNPRLTYLEVLQKQIASNGSIIAAIAEGGITGLGSGSGPSAADSSSRERICLEQRNEELRVQLRLQQAFDRKQSAFFDLLQGQLPQGNGVLTQSVMDEFDAAEEEFRAAQREVDRITQEIRDGRR